MARTKYRASRAYVAATTVSAFMLLLGALAVRDQAERVPLTAEASSINLTGVRTNYQTASQPAQAPAPHTRTKAS